VSVRHAFFAWQLINLVALTVALWLLWPSHWTPLLAVLFPPLLVNFKQGQDMPLFLLAIAVSAKLMHRRPFLAGAVLAFLGLKFHLILLLPVFLLMKRAWRMTTGLTIGAIVLIAGCFALYGRGWLPLYFAFILENQKHLQNPALIKSFSPAWLAIVVTAAGVLAIMMRRIKDREAALFAALGMSLVPAPHLYPYDVVLTFPLLLFAVRKVMGTTACPKRQKAWPKSEHAAVERSQRKAQE